MGSCAIVPDTELVPRQLKLNVELTSREQRSRLPGIARRAHTKHRTGVQQAPLVHGANHSSPILKSLKPH